MNENFRIVFFGTPDFAVPSLDILVKNHYNVAAVITAPDKPAGRGLKLSVSAVKKYALEKNLKLLQPENLSDEIFLKQLHELNPTLQIVVAFKKLPSQVWKMAPLGTFNLHASLLPDYRGAAPINWAIINGEKETGVTTFFINDEIDSGKIIYRAKENIHPDDTAGDVYERLKKKGADLVLKTVRAIESGNYTLEEQNVFLTPDKKIKPAPKIFKEDCKIDWKKSANDVYNFVRGLSPYPTAWTEIKKENKILSLKIFRVAKEIAEHQNQISSIHTDGKTFVKIAVNDGFINFLELQLPGRKKINIEEFLRGFSFEGWELVL
jgi:methionyl-tRNA formyltransferase